VSVGPQCNRSDTHELDNTLVGFNGIFVRVRASGAGIPQIGLSTQSGLVDFATPIYGATGAAKDAVADIKTRFVITTPLF